jgi:hypothetical protein
VITIEKIKLFNKYRGDIDGLARGGKSNELNLIDSDEWFLINNFIQDVELINSRLTTQKYFDETILKLKNSCNTESFEWFTNFIKYFKDFQEISKILDQIYNLINQNSNFDNKNLTIDEIHQAIKQIKSCDYHTLEKIKFYFLPTCTFQELSLSNNWNDEYLELSLRFDVLYKRLIEIDKTKKVITSQSIISWFKKLF